MIILLSFVACGLNAMDTGTVSFDCDRVTPLSYENFGKVYLSRHCNGCHSSLLPEKLRVGAPAGVDFDNISMVKEWADRISARATGTTPTMPPGGGPTPEEVVQFEEWLNCDLLPQVNGTSTSQD